MIADGYEQLAEQLRHDAIAGDYQAVIEAFLLFAWRDSAMPEWLIEYVLGALNFTLHHGGTAGKGGRGGTFDKQAKLHAMHLKRWAAVELQLALKPALSEQLDRKATSDDAFEAASKALAGTDARASRDTVKDSWKRIRRERRGAGWK